MDDMVGHKDKHKTSETSGGGTTTHAAEGGAQHPKASKAELLASAKVVADAAMGKNENMDKRKLAGAAEDLLNAAEEYGNLGEKGYGKYLDKAEDYLHKYHTATGHDPPKAGETKPAGSGKESKGDEKHEGGGGMGDVMKMAGGFFK